MNNAALQFQGIKKQYDKKIVLQDVALEVAKGESFGLVGMNGIGKTTLLKCLLDFSTPDEGAISIFGVSNRLTQARSPIAYLPERFVPPYYLTGLDFIKYMLALQARDYVESDALEVLDALDLDRSALTRPVRTYSKGMTQKLGLAACFLSDKDLYVLDEPMSGLDPKSRALLKARLKQLRAAGKTIFLISHALADVEEICDRMAIMHAGAVRFVGTPEECRLRFDTDSLEQAFMKCVA